MDKRGQPPLCVNLKITSEDKERFSTSKTFESISEVCRETGFSDVEIIPSYNSKRTTMRKRSNGFVYYFRLSNMASATSTASNPPKSEAPKNRQKCSKTPTFKDRKRPSEWIKVSIQILSNFRTLTKLLG